MELVTSLPAELFAIADPAARGAAPLLRPAEADADSSASTASFEACLALLGMPLPTGQAWPVTGKELPPAPLDLAAVAPDPAAVAPDTFATEAADAAVLARLKIAMPAPSDPLAAEPDLALPLAETSENAVSSSAAPPTVATPAFAADLPADETQPPSLVQDVAPLETTDAAAQAALADSSDLPNGLEPLAVHAEHASRSPKDSAALRRPATPYAAPASPPAVSAPPAATESTSIASNGVRPADAPDIVQPSAVTLAETPSASRAEWLPSAQGSAPSPHASAAQPAHVDMRSPDWQDALASRVQMLVDHDVGEARITLHPPELGALDIEISLVDDKTFVQLTASTAAARDELSQSLPRLRELLSVGGLELGGASVHDGRGGQRTPYGHDAAGAFQRSLAPLGELGGFADEAPLAFSSRPRGRIDVFA